MTAATSGTTPMAKAEFLRAPADRTLSAFSTSSRVAGSSDAVLKNSGWFVPQQLSSGLRSETFRTVECAV
jgi:hypothetical protein